MHTQKCTNARRENSTAFVTNHNIVSSNPLQTSDDSSDGEVCVLVTAYPLLIRGFGKEVFLTYLSSDDSKIKL